MMKCYLGHHDQSQKQNEKWRKQVAEGNNYVVVNFMCQLFYGGQIWSNIILDVSVRVFLDKLTFKLVGQFAPLTVSGLHPIN